LRLLLDAHAFLWWVQEDDRLPRSTSRLIADPSSQVSISAVTVWELVIKERLGRLRLDGPAVELFPFAIERDGFAVLPVEMRHALGIASLPLIHGDPFDRMLVAQAIEDSLTLVTGDRTLQAYPVDYVW
jgi:PIN domain nuclease of toxin-antitoxin system